ncbi:hypothetical protein HW555_008745 [Spodoptera exigua]|uniref:Carboxylesterase type B domain-containing protein n=1 Tax=Spodoptera exigua TaxID=7107 RepID=A0A835L2G0_SPOEX|nr:hypothetical protein HW555_008745 [Spodoptera exigua]
MITAVNDFLDDLRGGRMAEAPVVTVEQGQLQGRVVNSPTGKAFYSFQGIPYAKPPLGSLRFKSPQPPEPWDGIRDATAEGNVSAQIDFLKKEYIGDENCLFLNVYTPNLDGEFLPVMVFIHGGGFVFGSGNSSLYGGDYLVEKDVVVVTLNYRCGVLGFLSMNTPEIPGNAGLKDQVQALRWIKENIHNFGGNSGNITIFGESAGGVAVSLLTASPLTKGLISKAIIQSGSALSKWSMQKTPIENARNLAKILGCESDDPEEVLDFLNATSARELVEAHEKLTPMDLFPEVTNAFGVVVEKEFPGVEAIITEPFIDLLTSGRIAETPIMIGSTSLEFAFERRSDDLQAFIPEELNIERNSEQALEIAEQIKNLYFKGSHTGVESLPEYFELLSDNTINVDTHRHVQYLINVSKKPIYYYKFDYVGELNISKKILNTFGLTRAMHMDELGYLFRNDLQKDVEPTTLDIKMRERMLRLWTNFAKGGNPTPDENHYLTVTWLPVTKDNLYYLNLGQELSLGTNPDKEKMDFWDSLYSKYYRIWDHPRSNNDEVVLKSSEPKIIESYSETVTVYSESSAFTESHTYVSETTEIVKENNEIVSETHEFITENNGEPVETNEVVAEVSENHEAVVENNEAAVENNETVVESNGTVEENNEPIVENKEGVVKNVEVVEKNEIDHPKVEEKIEEPVKIEESHPTPVTAVLNGDRKVQPRPSNEIKMVSRSNGAPKDVIRANDPPEDDLPKNIGVNKFVNFFESLGGKK